MLEPDWPAPARVRALVTTRAMGDMAAAEGRAALRRLLPSEPRWLRQVHGKEVIAVDESAARTGDAGISRTSQTVCAVMTADCMPVFFTDDEASVVGVAHAGWRGLAGGVLEATIDAMGVAPGKLIAWLGPAIGPAVYEVGEDVSRVFDEAHLRPSRPGHWLLDLYAAARSRLRARGVARVHGGAYCTYSEPLRFFSYRRERAAGRMAAVIWLT
jgi:hypothetical protein